MADHGGHPSMRSQTRPEVRRESALSATAPLAAALLARITQTAAVTMLAWPRSTTRTHRLCNERDHFQRNVCHAHGTQGGGKATSRVAALKLYARPNRLHRPSCAGRGPLSRRF